MKSAVALGGILLLFGLQSFALWQDVQQDFWSSAVSPSVIFNQSGEIFVGRDFKQTAKDKNRQVYEYTDKSGTISNEISFGYKDYKSDEGKKLLEYAVSNRKINGVTYTNVTTFSGENRIWHQSFCRGNECFAVTGRICEDLKKKFGASNFKQLINDQKRCDQIASALNAAMMDKSNKSEMEASLKMDMENADKAKYGNTMGSALNVVSRTKTARLGETEKLSAYNMSMYLGACEKMEAFDTTDENAPPAKAPAKTPSKAGSSGTGTT
jgi:hypothetical protein